MAGPGKGSASRVWLVVMPFKSKVRKRVYQRKYMRQKRAEEKAEIKQKNRWER